MLFRPEFDFEERMRARYARECFFGLTEVALPAILGSTFLGASTAGGLGGLIGSGLGTLGLSTGAGTLGGALSTGLADAVGGAALGAGTGALTGNAGRGAELGALGGGVLGGATSALGAAGGTAAPAAASGGGGGSAAAVAPATGSLPVGSAVDPTVSATNVASQLGYNPSLSTAATYGGNAADATGTFPTTPIATPNLDTATLGPAQQAATPAQLAAMQATTQPTMAQLQAGLPSTPGFGSTSVGQFWNNPTWGGAGNIVASNPSAVVGALGLGYNLLNQGNVKGLGALTQAAGAQEQQSQQLESYLNTGTLPSGLQAGLDQSLQAAQQEIKSKYASLGMSGSTAEASDLAYAQVNAQAQKAQMEMGLLDSGIKESGLSDDLLGQIVKINQAQDAATGQAISNFAAALGGMPIRINTQSGTTGG
jgi:hypothetical protein